MRHTKVISGFSGAMKSTIIDRLDRNQYGVIHSPTKFWYNYNFTCNEGVLDTNPMIGLGSRIFAAKEHDKENLIVERSLYDFCYFAIKLQIPGYTSEKEFDFPLYDKFEEEVLGEREYYIIENQAHQFIKEHVLGTDPSRSDIYTTLDEYLEGQEGFLEFVTKHIKNYNYLCWTDSLLKEFLDNYDTFEIPWKKIRLQ